MAAGDDHLTIAAASALAGLVVAWTEGDIHAAHQSYALAADELARAGHVADVLGCTITLVDLELTGVGWGRRSVRRVWRCAWPRPRGRAPDRCAAPPTCTSPWPGWPGNAARSTPSPPTWTGRRTWGTPPAFPRTPT